MQFFSLDCLNYRVSTKFRVVEPGIYKRMFQEKYQRVRMFQRELSNMYVKIEDNSKICILRRYMTI